jgi:hypothetical protein
MGGGFTWFLMDEKPRSGEIVQHDGNIQKSLSVVEMQQGSPLLFLRLPED